MIPVLAMTNVFLLTFAPIAGMTEVFYNVSSLRVSMLSMSYMIVYILLALPASWLVDTKGFRLSMGIGAVVTAVFGLLRGVFAANFTIVTIAQFGLAVGQPFLINSITKVAARWFPVNERATAAGIATMAGYLGMIVAMVCTPLLTVKYGLEKMLLLYGYAAVASALIFILLSKEGTGSPSAESEEPAELNMKKAGSPLRKSNFIYLVLCVAIVMGIFNAVMTWIENLLMDAMQNIVLGGFPLSLVLLILIMLSSFFIALRLKESDFISGSNEKEAPHPTAAEIKQAREIVCNAGVRLLRSGLVSGTWGNISLRLNDDLMVITPSGKAYELLTPADMVVVSIFDLGYEGNIKPSGESGLHAEIYRQRKEINAIIHTHSPNACTVTAARKEVPSILDDMAQIIGPSVRVSEYAIPGTTKLIKGTVKALDGRNAALLANHGSICIGRTLEEAFATCEILEKACRTFMESEFLGGAIPINPIEAWVMHEYYLRKYSKSK